MDTLTVGDFIRDTARALSKIGTVYPLYIAARIKRALAAPDPEGIIASVGDVESLGNSRYAIPVTDTSGTLYRITVEVVS